jgi:gliding motility-associated lipoprotein GldH
MATMRFNRISPSFFLFVLSFWFFSCSENRIFEEFTGFKSLSWAASDTVTYELSGLGYDHVTTAIGVRYNDDYEFHNLYVRCFLKDSVGHIKKDTLINLGLFDSKTGKPSGRGFGNRLTLYDTLSFGGMDDGSKIQFVQYMRKDTLKGIEAIGLKITSSYKN